MKTYPRTRAIALLGLGMLAAGRLAAWDYEGHRIVNDLALAGLPGDMPAFVRTPSARERVLFLAGEPDRWRNSSEMVLQHANNPDHFFDVEYLPLHGIDPLKVSPFRYEFLAQFALARAAHPDVLGSIDPEKNRDHTRELPGFLPWAITEQFAKLQSAFSYLRAYEQSGSETEVENARANVLAIMGTMGHFVGDAAQPLHTTRYYNGWFGPNPEGFTTVRTFHAWIDGGYLLKIGLTVTDLRGRTRAAQLVPVGLGEDGRSRTFVAVMDYVLAQHQKLEPLYRLEKAGGFSGEGEAGLRGRAFLEEQFLVAGEMLSSLWLTAWRTAPVDNYLMQHLPARPAQTAAPTAK